MDRSAKRLLIVSTNLDGFSLTNCRQFAKLFKNFPTTLSHHIVKCYMLYTLQCKVLYILYTTDGW